MATVAAVTLPGFRRAETFGLLFTGYLLGMRRQRHHRFLDDGSVLEIENSGIVVEQQRLALSNTSPAGMVTLTAAASAAAWGCCRAGEAGQAASPPTAPRGRQARRPTLAH